MASLRGLRERAHLSKSEASMTSKEVTGRDGAEIGGAAKGRDFIREIVEKDLHVGNHQGVVTRFPPEPNGYLHIGHAKSICLNFGIAREFGGCCHLRFDDTNPSKEEQEFVDSIMEDVRWLGWEWGGHLYYASDYFQQLHDWAVHLVREGKAYVCDLNADEVRAHRGTLTEPGKGSPYRDRSAEENLDLFARMKAGEFPDGSRTLRAKIDMAHPNMNLRDPVLYRILRATHQRTGDAWCIYPMYDYAHGQSDAIEGITHSICTLEFEAHRPLYEWFIENLPVPAKPRQFEFARLELTYTLLSKRKLLELVSKGYVSGWDDPRMPTIAALRRRGFTPEAIRAFCDKVGVAKSNSVVDLALLEECQRDDLNKRALRRMAVLRPLKVILENYPDGQVDSFELPNNPEDSSAGMRSVPFSKAVFIEREDFMEVPPPKFFRLSPGREVRLRGAYLVTCTGVVKDERGEVTELRCTVDPATKGGTAPDGRSPKATLHWVSAAHAAAAEVRLTDRLFTKADPEDYPEGLDYKANLNPDSLVALKGCKVEGSLADAKPGDRFQFERQGYFCCDRDSVPGAPVFNRTVTLKDAWARAQAKGPKRP
jgi:glutaminyl-tRNA synthetase